MNPDTIGCVWTGEFDLNTLRVDGEIFESGKKKLRIQKYPDTCGRGLSDTESIRHLLKLLSQFKVVSGPKPKPCGSASGKTDPTGPLSLSVP